MDIQQSELAQERVLKKHPDAFVVDDGERVSIKIRKTVKDKCPHCGQAWKHEMPGLTLGAGGSSEYAWLDAARSLGLIP